MHDISKPWSGVRVMNHLAGRYKHNSHCKDMLKAHLIFVTRFRKRILTHERAGDVKQYLYDTANSHGWKIHAMETDKDHVHILIQYKPTDRISKIVKALKQESTYQMWQRHSVYLNKNYWCQKTLWSKGYFYASIGEVSDAAIRKYIENQG